jgi:NADPH:quinone reductase-like Zn-dependent oxidoreductase
MQLAATLFTKGVDLNFETINFPDSGVKRPTLLTDLPKYSWNHSTKYWHQSRISEQHRFREFPRNDIVGTLANYSNELEPTWRNIIRADDQPWVRHHKMQSMTVYPFAGYIAMALEAAAQRAVMRHVKFDKFDLREVTVSRPLVIHEGSDVETNVQLRPFTEGTRVSSDAWDEFRIFSWAKDRGWIEHAHGLIAVSKRESNVVDGERQLHASKEALRQQVASINESSKSDVNPSELYEVLSAIGAEYGSTFQGLENCRASDDHAVADVVIPDTAATMPKSYEPDFIIHPAFLDQMIQIVWPILGAARTGLDVLYMPSFVHSLSIATGITTKAGDRLKVYATGRPAPSKPAATKFSFFTTPSEGGDEALISMESMVLMPVLEGSDSPTSALNRELCYKMQWEPAFNAEVNGSENHTEPTVVANGSATFSPELEVSIICYPESQPELVTSLKELLTNSVQRTPMIGRLGEIKTEGCICIVLEELVRPVVSDLNPTKFKAIQDMTSSASGILWAVRGAYTDSESPDSQMVVGMARSIRSETLLKFTTLDLGVSPQLSDIDTADKIFDVFKHTFSSDAPVVGIDLEYQERNGQFFVPRIVDDAEMNKFVRKETHPSAAPDLQPFSQEGRSLKIAIETPGALDTLYFTDDLAVGTPLPGYEVEIEVKATSMNFKDIMISMGQLASDYIGVECSGVITAIGSKVTDVRVGDRVCAMSEGAYSTHARCRGTSVQKIADNMSFEDAATIPVIYCTAYYSLFDLGRLTKGETVLIHAAAGGVGQAAIILCQMVGAEIFATVGSVAKKEFLISQYGLQEDHIFYSRNTSFSKGIRRATNGQGVDLVLNSLSSDALRETWESLAHFGRFIEIGKRDIVGNSRLEMSRFEHNAMFASVDLTLVASERPKLMQRLLSDVFDLISKGLARPISPITKFPISDVEVAFRTLQSGKIMGKIVIVPRPNDKVMAVPAKTKQLLGPDSTYIIIGGTGGLGRSMTRWMIEKGARHIVLVSRSGQATGKVAELIEEANSAEAQIEVRPCDVSKKEQVEELVDTGISGMPPIRGVIHAAMVLDVSHLQT